MELTSSSGALTWAHVFGQICWRFKSRTEALSDPEIKSLTKEWEENTHRGSQCEWVVRGERRRHRNVAYVRTGERGRERVSLALDRPCPLRPPDTESTLGVCVDDDVSVKYIRVNWYENKNYHGPRRVCVCVCVCAYVFLSRQIYEWMWHLYECVWY